MGRKGGRKEEGEGEETGKKERRGGEEGRKRKKGRNSHLTHHLLSSWQLWEHLSPQMTLHMTLEAAKRLIIHSTY